jgi:hypothetical protein
VTERMILGRRVTWNHRPSTKKGNPWGRFGGGWDWHIGIQGGGSTVLVFLLFGYLRIEKPRKP